ncbi:MAG: GNAT family N-acetyltransferase [Isosphaerales bacterium]
MLTTPVPSPVTLESLPWDSHHFGFPVARMMGLKLGELELREGLCSARRMKVKLVYWAADPGGNVPQPILDEFGGLFVDRKATFQKTLPALGPESDALQSWRITEHPRTDPAVELVRLAVTAGSCSRFRLDPRIPRESFKRLYELWIVRSVLGELADMVFVAARGRSTSEPAGLITVRLTGGQGSIGLIAVDELARGQGIGTRLIQAAHRWLLARGVKRVTVVTQLDNQAACRFYEKCGYEQVELRHVYHFWI